MPALFDREAWRENCVFNSLIRFVKGPRAPWLVADTVLAQSAVEDTAAGWNRYLALKIDRPARMRSQVHRCSLRVSP